MLKVKESIFAWKKFSFPCRKVKAAISVKCWKYFLKDYKSFKYISIFLALQYFSTFAVMEIHRYSFGISKLRLAEPCKRRPLGSQC